MYKWDRKLNETDANDDGDDDATQHFTACVALHCTLGTLTSTSTESAHHERAQSCSLCTLHPYSLWLKFEPCPHSTHDHHHGHPCGCCLFDLTSSFYLFAFLLSVFLFPFFLLSDEQQPELNKKIMENLCNSASNGVRAPTTSSTSPDFYQIVLELFHATSPFSRSQRARVMMCDTAKA